MTDRTDFLKLMYEQMFRDIEQHYTVVWQSAATVFASFAIIALSEKQLIPLDLGIGIVLLLTIWFMLNIVECSYWYNRNLCIIANIERQFLIPSDLREVQYYFGAHRPANRMNSHLRNQGYLGLSLAALVLFYHFATRVLPGLGLPWSDFDPMRLAPYVVAVCGMAFVIHRRRLRNEAYEEFLKNSPGVEIDVSGIHYGRGHGHANVKAT
jgi:hypothetical protein